MKLKALIVDDEYPARQELRFLLNNFDNIEIVGEAANAQEALALIKALDYQILFLDISMPGMTGLELGAAIQGLPQQPHVIFVTAYDEYAVQAFEVNAVDYLLKPVEPGRLKKAIDKVVKANHENSGTNTDKAGNDTDKAKAKIDPSKIRIDRIPAEKQGKTVLVAESDIFYAFTEQDYIYIKTFTDKLLTRFTLKELEARLNPQVFFRTHRCYLVNLHKVREIVPFFNGTYNLVVEDKENSEVPVSRAQAKKLRKILGF
ncbi:two component transcriptional regulator, LytTR family [Desulfotomaculum arcticum]|uniref:Stage 0 sporulation protein A homolog n=1 Tax=Desulfotruncus arcticus DSM 17038 TaxID=1121424 RepID=A0A1I2NEY8_9FIRM|nr:LytTR family DNA-binding domain-containing protein [Desulfotruncus arcticus]SFG00247.1 two component transcriptional regulator, LytTR family [Desulfotomaculum arcticum] [Desulfotruncus arcticus DSM 17038]